MAYGNLTDYVKGKPLEEAWQRKGSLHACRFCQFLVQNGRLRVYEGLVQFDGGHGVERRLSSSQATMFTRVAGGEERLCGLRVCEDIVIGRFGEHSGERVDGLDGLGGVKIILVRPESDDRACVM